MMNDLILGHAPRQQMAARIAALSWRPDVECYYGCSGPRLTPVELAEIRRIAKGAEHAGT